MLLTSTMSFINSGGSTIIIDNDDDIVITLVRICFFFWVQTFSLFDTEISSNSLFFCIIEIIYIAYLKKKKHGR